MTPYKLLDRIAVEVDRGQNDIAPGSGNAFGIILSICELRHGTDGAWRGTDPKYEIVFRLDKGTTYHCYDTDVICNLGHST
jgi:hypothetical protein